MFSTVFTIVHQWVLFSATLIQYRASHLITSVTVLILSFDLSTFRSFSCLLKTYLVPRIMKTVTSMAVRTGHQRTAGVKTKNIYIFTSNINLATSYSTLLSREQAVYALNAGERQLVLSCQMQTMRQGYSYEEKPLQLGCHVLLCWNEHCDPAIGQRNRDRETDERGHKKEEEDRTDRSKWIKAEKNIKLIKHLCNWIKSMHLRKTYFTETLKSIKSVTQTKHVS